MFRIALRNLRAHARRFAPFAALALALISAAAAAVVAEVEHCLPPG